MWRDDAYLLDMLIAEAATKVSKEFREEHVEIDWPNIIGMRNRLVHDYRNINVKKVWKALDLSSGADRTPRTPRST